METDAERGIAWWNGLDEEERAEWLERAGNTGIAADAWEAYKTSRRPNMSNEITHRRDPDDGHMQQVVSPERLREILDSDGENYERPKHFGPTDEWDVAT